MRLLRKAALTRVITPDNVETFIKELLETPETWGKNTIVTKLIFCASGVDGETLRGNIFHWLEHLKPKVVEPISEEDLKIIAVPINSQEELQAESDKIQEAVEDPEKSPLTKAFDALLPEDSDGKTA